MTQVLRHVVMFGFNEGVSAGDLAEVARRFGALRDQIPGILAFEWGENVSPEGLSDGLSHCFFMTFESEAARDAYLPHPTHQAFVAWIGAFVAKAVVVDYWAEAESA